MLWGRSGNMCAFPDCKKVLVVDETATDDPSIIGEEAHIVGQKETGPRGFHPLEFEKRDNYDNLILLCLVHHKVVDDQQDEYTVENLHHFKDEHEKWVKGNLITDIKKIRDDELYATYIEKVTKLAGFDNWNIWTSWVFGSTEIFPKLNYDSLFEVSAYIIARIWPKRYPLLESAFYNFKSVVNDLFKIYAMHMEERGNAFGTEKFYRAYNYENCSRRGEEFDPHKEQAIIQKYMFHTALIEDLFLELTRAANYLCDRIREYIFEGFRLEEGTLLITRGDFLSSTTIRAEYRGEERTEFPYPGLRAFMEARVTRDMRIGEGVDEDYFKKNPWEQ